MITSILAALNNDDGASLVEYALIVALVAVVAIGGLQLLGNNTNAALSNATASISS